MKLFKGLTLTFFCVAVFLVNPLFFGCGGDSEDPFTFGADEMSAMVTGNWQGTMEFDGREAVSFELILNQVAQSSSTQQNLRELRQPMCGNRTFVASAQACVATSEMPLEGTLTIDGEDPLDVEGYFLVMGHHLSAGDLFLSTDEDTYRINLELRDDQVVHQGSINEEPSESTGTISIQR